MCTKSTVIGWELMCAWPPLLNGWIGTTKSTKLSTAPGHLANTLVIVATSCHPPTHTTFPLLDCQLTNLWRKCQLTD